MEIQVVRRRANVIATRLGASSHEDVSATATHVFRMSCSNSVNSLVGRCDNRMNFARQGSTSQGSFMKQASNDQGNYIKPASAIKSTVCADMGTNAFEPPMFSKPAQAEPGVPSVVKKKSVVQGCRYNRPGPEAPMFARLNEKCGQPQFQSKELKHNFASKGLEWSPRMDTVESGLNYFQTLEVPGVSVHNVKVDVNDRSLVVTGTRSTWSCGEKICSNKLVLSYQKREILQGLYRIVWPLPTNANKDHVSAEIQDGLLRITIPKLSGLRWLRKAHL